MSAPTAFLNARVIDPDQGLDGPGGVLIGDNRIAAAGPAVTADQAGSDTVQVDCAGLVLAPGFVDGRVQLGEPGAEHKETIDSASRAAAAGGVTTLAALPNTDPPVDDEAGIELIARRAREVKGVKIHPYAALTQGLNGADLTPVGLLRDAGALAFTDGDRAVADAGTLSRALTYARGFGALVIQHPEEPSLAAGGSMTGGSLATRLGLSGIPAAAEVMQVERDLRLAEMTGGKLHIGHVSTAGAVHAIRRAKEDGLDVTCDTAPIYCALTEDAIGTYRTFAKVSPPLRQEHHRRAVVQGLADGTIDWLASDHVPQDQDSKRQPFAEAAFGAIGLETLLPLGLGLVQQGHLSLPALLARLTAAPARRLGLAAGTLKPGAPADLVLVDPEAPWRIEPEALHSKSKNTPLEHHPVQGRVQRTVVDGRTLYHAG